ncbi:DUF547 domain-containing protein [Planctomycetota bacterium]|nr:DUF547 domain-containing protein [Planctomycetota bacterium]
MQWNKKKCVGCVLLLILLTSSVVGLFSFSANAQEQGVESGEAGNMLYQKKLAIYDKLLKKNVDDDGWVDYAKMFEQREQLRDYINSLRNIDLSKLGRDDQLATLINAYNAFTLELIIEYWDNGKLTSIFEIPEKRRWDDDRWQIGNKTYSLNELEHKTIRPMFKEPRIHFALVCAAYSCPILRNEVYRGDWLEKQLQQQTEYVLNHDRWYDYDPVNNVVSLTQLFNWYKVDFEKNSQDVFDFVAKYRPEIAEALENGRRPKVEWIEYDWRLNDVRNRVK